MNFEEQLDDFWRETLRSGVANQKAFQLKYAKFVNSLQSQVSHLQQNRNAEYIALAQRDREALKVRLGVPTSPAANDRLAQVAAETAVRATVWQSIAALFRVFR